MRGGALYSSDDSAAVSFGHFRTSDGIPPKAK